jgi:hypothetical protein
MLLGDCQGIVGLRKSDFDFCHCMSQIFPHVTRIHFYTLFTHPKVMPDVNAETIQERKQQLAIQIGPYPQYACSSHIYTHSWRLRPSDRINLSSPDNNPLENNIVDQGSLHRRVVKINWPEQFSSRTIPANVFAAFDYALQIISSTPEPGRDRISLPRLWLSYKITASKAIGRCPVVGGTLVPIFQRNVKFRKLSVLILYN